MTSTDEYGKNFGKVISDDQAKARTHLVNEMVALSSLNDSKYV